MMAPVALQILIQHRASDDEMRLVEQILAPLKSRYVHLSYDEHDEVTANTQAVTHAAFLRSVPPSLRPCRHRPLRRPPTPHTR